MQITNLGECHGGKLVVSVEGQAGEDDVVEHIRLGFEILDEFVESGTLRLCMCVK